MTITPDQVIFWSYGPIHLNLTIINTWIVMGVLTGFSWSVTRGIRSGTASPRLQGILEVIVLQLGKQIEEVGLKPYPVYLGFLGTLFLYIAASSLLSILPTFEPPTGSLSTTVALALCVFAAVPYFAVRRNGVGAFLRTYLEPTPLMLPFNVIGEASRTLALSVRLFGNMMSDTLIVGILLAITPLFFPVLMKLLGLLTGMVQAYIFSILATVYIAGAVQVNTDRSDGLSAQGGNHGQ